MSDDLRTRVNTSRVILESKNKSYSPVVEIAGYMHTYQAPPRDRWSRGEWTTDISIHFVRADGSQRDFMEIWYEDEDGHPMREGQDPSYKQFHREYRRFKKCRNRKAFRAQSWSVYERGDWTTNGNPSIEFHLIRNNSNAASR